MLPALAGQFIVSIKDSSLVALISIQELTFMTSEVSSTTRRFFEVWLFTAALYFCVCFSCSMLFRTLERRWKQRGMTRIACSIPLDAPGLHIGHLAVPFSDDAHAYGVIPVPIAVLARRCGTRPCC